MERYTRTSRRHGKIAPSPPYHRSIGTIQAGRAPGVTVKPQAGRTAPQRHSPSLDEKPSNQTSRLNRSLPANQRACGRA